MGRKAIYIFLRNLTMREAELWRAMPNKAVSCFLCQRRCYIKEGEEGICRVRKNDGGKLYSINWGKCAGYNLDPIEKKPFYHFMPGSHVFSFAAPGCNFDCEHCQNYDIAQPKEIVGLDMKPEEMVEKALAYSGRGMAYTYTEPTIFYEYAKDTARLARKRGLYNVWVSNGYMTPETIATVDFLDAMKIDLKGFSERFYKEVCGGAHLEPVLKSIKTVHGSGKHLEIVTLIIPTWNDSEDELQQLAKWLHDVDPEIPLHFTGYYPANRMTVHSTQQKTLERARSIALEEGLVYVYTGNRPGTDSESTFCPKCKTKVIERWGMEMLRNHLVEGNKCPECKTELPIIYDWKKQTGKKRS
jgi:pyruvate formate lyase activating enzyme